MNPLPSMAQAFALLVQEEKQREFKASSQMFAEASSMKFSMLASAPGPPGGRQQQFKTNYSFSSNNNGRSRPLCDYCKKLRHTKDKCFKSMAIHKTDKAILRIRDLHPIMMQIRDLQPTLMQDIISFVSLIKERA